MAIIEQGMQVKRIGNRKAGGYCRTRGRLFYFLAGGIAAVVAVIAFCIYYFSFETLYIGDYVKTEYSGIDGKGKVVISLKGSDSYGDFFSNVSLDDDAAQGELKNGDTINVEFSFDPELAKKQGLRIKDEGCQITVDELPKGFILNEAMVFAPMEIETSGYSPEIKLSVKNTSEQGFFKDVVYEIPSAEEQKCYKSGEKVHIKALVPVEQADSFNYYVDGSGIYKMDYTIPETDSYLRDPGKITKAMLEELDSLAQKLVVDFDGHEYGLRIFSEANLMPLLVNGKTFFKWQDPKLLSAYFTTLSEDKYGLLEYHNNDLKMVYEATLMQSDGVNCKAEIVVQFTDLLVNKDGSIDLAKDSGRVTAGSYKNSNIVNLVRATDDDAYTATKLEID